MKVRKSGTGRDSMTKFQQADEMDARSIRGFVNDPKSWNPLYLYHAPGVLTFAGAVLSAQEADLSTFDQSKAVIKQCQGGHFTVHVTVTNGSSSRGGAGSHPESIVARGFAYRNAVRQMILNGEGDRQ